jgi:hypothetical protein
MSGAYRHHVPAFSVEPEKRTVTGIVFKAAALVLRRGVAVLIVATARGSRF